MRLLWPHESINIFITCWPHEQASHKHIHNLLASLIVGYWVAGSGNEATVAS